MEDNKYACTHPKTWDADCTRVTINAEHAKQIYTLSITSHPYGEKVTLQVRNLSSHTACVFLAKAIGLLGRPTTAKTSNGYPFTTDKVQKFFSDNGIAHDVDLANQVR